MKQDVQLHIDELLLDGFDPRDRYRIADALELELSRLLGDSNLHRISRDPTRRERIDTESVDIDAGASARDVGARIAGAIHAAIDGGRK